MRSFSRLFTHPHSEEFMHNLVFFSSLLLLLARSGHALRGGVRGLRMQEKAADLRYVAPAASDESGQVRNPAVYPTELYPEIEAFESGMLAVGDGRLYYDVSGNPEGVPASSSWRSWCWLSPRCRRFFDPSVFKIVILDQRGSGNSRPNAADDLEAHSLRIRPRSSSKTSRSCVNTSAWIVGALCWAARGAQHSRSRKP